jgi:putative oxidoreductase
MAKLFSNDGSWTQLLLRLSLALVIFPHGAQKLLGWFGGYGFTGTMGFFTEQMGLSTVLAFTVIMVESIGALAIALGLATRLAAAGIIAVMVGAIVTVHLPHGFFMNWFGNQAGEGFEFHLLTIAIAGAVVLRGAGKWALESALAGRLPTRGAVLGEATST